MPLSKRPSSHCRLFVVAGLLAGLLALAAPARAALQIEAEARTSMDNAGTVQKYGGGTSYMDMGAEGSFLEWNNITVSDAGTFLVTFRYALGNNVVNCHLDVNANSANKLNNASSQSKLFPLTGGWTTWSTISFIVNLNAGANKIRLVQEGHSGPNIDSLKIYSAKTKYHEGITSDGDVRLYEPLPPGLIAGYECLATSLATDRFIMNRCELESGHMSYYFDGPNIQLWFVDLADLVSRMGAVNYRVTIRYWD